MRIYLSGHYSNSFLIEVAVREMMKIYLVNISSTSGGY